MKQEKKALISLHQQRSSYGDVGIKLKERGFKIDIKKPSLGDKLPENMNDHDVAIIYGGPMSANDNDNAIKYETDWISTALESKKPFLGICLGGQMLANNLGGSVQRAHDKSHEIGFFDIIPNEEGLEIFQPQKTFFQWHNEGFTVPSSCKMHLAWLYYAAYKLKEPGAQTRIKQLNLRIKHGKKINMWLDHFLDNYLLKA